MIGKTSILARRNATATLYYIEEKKKLRKQFHRRIFFWPARDVAYSILLYYTATPIRARHGHFATTLYPSTVC